MNIGKKIQILRKFRNMTQAELGVAIGFKPESAANRITQYETNYRVPKQDALIEMSEVLNVSKYNFLDTDDVACDFILSLFWIDPMEDGKKPMILPWMLHGTHDEVNGYSVLGHWIATTTAFDPKGSPMPRPFIEFNDDSINSYLVEWNQMRADLYDEKISKEEYLDWKFNWYERKCEPTRIITYRAEDVFPD